MRPEAALWLVTRLCVNRCQSYRQNGSTINHPLPQIASPTCRHVRFQHAAHASSACQSWTQQTYRSARWHREQRTRDRKTICTDRRPRLRHFRRALEAGRHGRAGEGPVAAISMIEEKTPFGVRRRAARAVHHQSSCPGRSHQTLRGLPAVSRSRNASAACRQSANSGPPGSRICQAVACHRGLIDGSGPVNHFQRPPRPHVPINQNESTHVPGFFRRAQASGDVHHLLGSALRKSHALLPLS